jgi:hypothetical protein
MVVLTAWALKKCYIPSVLKEKTSGEHSVFTTGYFSLQIIGLPRRIKDHENYASLLRDHFEKNVLKGRSRLHEVTLARDWDGAISAFMEVVPSAC